MINTIVYCLILGLPILGLKSAFAASKNQSKKVVNVAFGGTAVNSGIEPINSEAQARLDKINAHDKKKQKQREEKEKRRLAAQRLKEIKIAKSKNKSRNNIQSWMHEYSQHVEKEYQNYED